jgi:hypothetical protein
MHNSVRYVPCGHWQVHEGDLWASFEELLRKEHPDAVIAALQLYSDKTQMNWKGPFVAHPILPAPHPTRMHRAHSNPRP